MGKQPHRPKTLQRIPNNDASLTPGGGNDGVSTMHTSLRSISRIRPKWSPPLACVALVLSMVGCGSDLAEVRGTVTVDDQPLRGGSGVRATVVFQPASGGGAPGVGLIDESGNFTLSSGADRGVRPGDYVVTVTATQLIPDKSNPSGPASGRRITDARYANAKTSGFQFTVEPGRNDFHLALQSKASR